MKGLNKALDTSFVKNLDELSKDESAELVLSEAISLCEDLKSMTSRRDRSIQKKLNDKLASGRCFVKDEILFYRADNGDIEPAWFPMGNALEWQRDNGRIPQGTAEMLIKNKYRLEKLVNADKKNKK